MRSFDLHPMPESIWAVIKGNILKQRDMSESDLPSRMCIVPRDMADEFIEEVETLIKIPKYREMTWRLVGTKMNLILHFQNL